MITRHTVAKKLTDYLQHRLTLEEIVDWAHEAMMDGEFDDCDLETLRDVISRLGLADVKAFGITWEDCEAFLASLGYQIRIDVSEVA